MSYKLDKFYVIFRQLSPCPEQCAQPYGFKNQMSLTKDTNRFSVRLFHLSRIFDDPQWYSVTSTFICILCYMFFLYSIIKKMNFFRKKSMKPKSLVI